MFDKRGRMCVGSFARANIQRPQAEEAEKQKKMGNGAAACRVRRQLKGELERGTPLRESGSAIIYTICCYLGSREEGRKGVTCHAVTCMKHDV
jgi:hypothetical protein